MAYDEHNLYVFVRAFDPHPDSIVALLSRRDDQTASDYVTLMLDPYHDRRTGYEFSVNPAGVKTDYAIYNDGDEDIAWDAVWDAATRIDSLGWTAEYRIPLSQLHYSSKGGGTFGLLIWRVVQRHTATITWPLYRTSASGFTSQFGTLTGLDGLGSPGHAEITPYVVTKNVTDAELGRLRAEPGRLGRRRSPLPARVDSLSQRDGQSGFRPGGGGPVGAQPERVRDVLQRAAAVLRGGQGAVHVHGELRRRRRLQYGGRAVLLPAHRALAATWRRVRRPGLARGDEDPRGGEGDRPPSRGLLARRARRRDRPRVRSGRHHARARDQLRGGPRQPGLPARRRQHRLHPDRGEPVARCHECAVPPSERLCRRRRRALAVPRPVRGVGVGGCEPGGRRPGGDRPDPAGPGAPLPAPGRSAGIRLDPDLAERSQPGDPVREGRRQAAPLRDRLPAAHAGLRDQRHRLSAPGRPAAVDELGQPGLQPAQPDLPAAPVELQQLGVLDQLGAADGTGLQYQRPHPVHQPLVAAHGRHRRPARRHLLRSLRARRTRGPTGPLPLALDRDRWRRPPAARAHPEGELHPGATGAGRRRSRCRRSSRSRCPAGLPPRSARRSTTIGTTSSTSTRSRMRRASSTSPSPISNSGRSA